tara:strand:+ start:1522 stop:1968 length:447 start_codon:yes stop_codon:yes gene_type:complete
MAKATQFYDVVDIIKQTLLEDDFVNSVSYGDITKVDTSKTTIYPLSHMVVNSVVVGDNMFTFNVSIASMDLIDQVNDNEGDNEMNIFNTQSSVLSRLILKMRRYNMRNNGFQIVGQPSLEYFTHRFEDDVAGVDTTFEVNVIQDMNVC